MNPQLTHRQILVIFSGLNVEVVSRVVEREAMSMA